MKPKWISNLWSRVAIRKKSVARNLFKRSMRMEPLEERRVFAVGVGIDHDPVDVMGPALLIQGTAGNDQVTVTWLHNDKSELDDQVIVRDQNGVVGRYNLWDWDELDAEWKVTFRSIEFHGGKGDDIFRINGDTPIVARGWDVNSGIYDPMSVVAFGDEGNDYLEGGNGFDVLHGGAGNDILIGHASIADAVDYLYGDQGDDALFGDELPGAESKSYAYDQSLPHIGNYGYYNSLDELYGGDGNDLLYSGPAYKRYPWSDLDLKGDLLVGGAGNDSLEASMFAVMHGDFLPSELAKSPGLASKSGNDVFFAHSKSDIYAGGGNDTINGSNDPDLIFGGDGNDVIDGNGGLDEIYGGKGDDTIRGGDGSDKIYGNEGINRLEGGNGDDTLIGGDQKDRMFGGDGDDHMVGGGGDDEMFGGLGNDYVSGDAGNDYMWGDTGNDSMFGGSGNDLMYGASGDDFMEGNDGNDTLGGGIGNDRLFGQNGQDTLYGEAGDDELDGGVDLYWDTLVGGSGKDKFRVDLTGLGGSVKNRDKPVDFNAVEGDYYI